MAKRAALASARGTVRSRYADASFVSFAARAAKLTNEASAYRLRTVPLAEAKAARFANQLAAYNASPRVYQERAYLSALINGSVGARKYILSATNTHDVILLNLEDKQRHDMSDVIVTPATPVK